MIPQIEKLGPTEVSHPPTITKDLVAQLGLELVKYSDSKVFSLLPCNLPALSYPQMKIYHLEKKKESERAREVTTETKAFRWGKMF